VLGIIGSFQVFTSAYVMTNGGPNNATLMYVLYLYNNAFRFFKMGKASAMAWVLFVILLVFTLIQFKNASKWVYYEGGDTES
jgi:multiple sugar transport system permease protein